MVEERTSQKMIYESGKYTHRIHATDIFTDLPHKSFIVGTYTPPMDPIYVKYLQQNHVQIVISDNSHQTIYHQHL